MAHERRFPCFGTTCVIRLDGEVEDAAATLDDAERTLLDWHARFSRFEAGSELSRLNADPRTAVPVTPTMARFVTAARAAAELTDGLVDPTLVGEIERAGYIGDLGERLPLERALALAGPRHPAAGRPERRWRELVVSGGDVLDDHAPDPAGGAALDSGGIAKGLFADLLGARLARHTAWVVDCGGDLRVGGVGRLGRPVDVRSPFNGARILHRFVVQDAGVATSSIANRQLAGGRRPPRSPPARPVHGRPAFTGVVQATALAPTAAEAEARAKAAVLGGPGAGAGGCRTAASSCSTTPRTRSFSRGEERATTSCRPGFATSPEQHKWLAAPVATDA